MGFKKFLKSLIDEDKLSQEFSSLNVSQSTPDVTRPPQSSPSPSPSPLPHQQHIGNQFNGPVFVGGFHMPAPSTSSLTMQYALNNNHNNANYLSPPPLPRPPRVVSDPPPSFPHPVVYDPFSPSSLPSSPTRPPPKPSPDASVSSSPPKLIKPGRLRASSTPPSPTTSAASSPSSADEITQCAGVTKAGKRCTRQVKSGPAYSSAVPEDKTIERFCFQHTKEVLSSSGIYIRSQWIDFADYIPDYLSPDTQAALRAEMGKKRSTADEEGYIYTFEIRDPDDKKNIKLKVGRTVNVVRRINDWGKQCGSKEQVLRGYYPRTTEDGDDEDDSLMKGRVRAGGQGVWCHRLERLIHLELADLATSQQYLEPGWKPFVKGVGKGPSQQMQAAKTKLTNSSKSSSPSSSASSPPGTPNRSKKALGLGNGGGYVPCEDCGSIHKEIFQFKRFGKGRYEGKEWELIVRTVIEGWGMFVKDFVEL
ncbi:hypothetical protein VKT23_013111 [Stygiomarasmius scandens]|uniref:Uncharacterized protein n=1 Tax=Marasmiellus scandens TaxID=2682957 RepID=A0ABR1J8X8_9AGAR